MTFSIIIPVFNRKYEFFRALQSILLQPHQETEVVVVDDGSTDGLESFFKKLPQNDTLILIQQSNQGVSAARNAGAAAAKGTYLIFLDSDDELTENALTEFQYSVSLNPDLDVVFGDALIYTDGKNSDTRRAADPYKTGRAANTGLFLAGAFCIRKSFFEKAGGYDPLLAYGENTEFFWRVFEHVPITAVINQPVVQIHRPSDKRVSINPKNISRSVEHLIVKHAARFSKQVHLHWIQLNVLANAYFRQRKFTKAVTALMQSIRLRPFSWVSYFRLLRVFVLYLILKPRD